MEAHSTTPLAPIVAIPLDRIALPQNYRQGMAPTPLADLAASIISQGLVQAVLVRPLVGDEAQPSADYELVFGNRRYAAHQLAGLPTIQATIRPLSTREAEELRLIENVHRENPHPADEARAVAQLLANGADRVETAARLGKSTRWVAQRQALGHLLADWFELLRSDKLTLSAAEELARWPHEVQQRLLAKNTGSSGPSVETVRFWLHGERHNLSAAPWQLTDPTLLPAAGACHGCQKRSSCVADLFAADEVGKKDTCLDRACWAAKLDAKIARLLAERSTAEQPAVRISEQWSADHRQALPVSRYEVVSKRKGAIPAVLVDGPHAGHGRYIQLIGSALTVSKSGVPEPQRAPVLSKGEQMKKSRREKLLKESTKLVIAERLSKQVFADEVAVARPAVAALLVDMITQQLLRNRVRVDEGTLRAMQTRYDWPQPGEKSSADEQWVRAQVRASAPGDDTQKLLYQLLFVTIHHELGAEFLDYQSALARRLDLPDVLAELPAAAELQLAQHYDPKTLRRLKVAA